VAELVRQVAEAAHALHEKGIVHRDVKPDNIMVGPDGASAVLMDLGLAQVADEVQGRLTRTRQFVGTLRYASPEQVLAAARLDRRSDVYSLGATLWELLTLRPLFGATEQMPTPELMQKIQIEEPGRVRSYSPAVPRDLAAIVDKCLQKDPRKRYATAQELAAELENFLAGRPVKARPVTGAERLWKWARRRPAVASLLGAVAVVAAAGLAGILWAYGEALRQAEQVEEQKEKQREQIVRLNVMMGLLELEGEDGFSALLRFAEALSWDRASPDQHSHRTRIATTLGQCPRLIEMRVLHGPVLARAASWSPGTPGRRCDSGTRPP
jgi:hypothetical protein